MKRPAPTLRAGRRFVDGATTVLVTGGGWGVLLVLLLMLVFLTLEAIPLLKRAELTVVARQPWTGAPPVLALPLESNRVLTLSPAGELSWHEPGTGGAPERYRLPLAGSVTTAAVAGNDIVYVGTDRGRVVRLTLRRGAEPPGFDELVMMETPVRELAVLELDGGETIIAALTADDRVALGRIQTRPDLAVATWRDLEINGTESMVRGLHLLRFPAQLLLLHADGSFQRWGLEESDAKPVAGRLSDLDAIAASATMPGERSLLVAARDGSLRRIAYHSGRAPSPLSEVAVAGPVSSPVIALQPRGAASELLSQQADGTLNLHFVPTGDLRLSLPAAVDWLGATGAGGNNLAGISAGELVLWRLSDPHPTAGFRALWGAVQWDGYPEPVRVWQATTVDDTTPSKFSLLPLAVGTLKVAFYTMLVAAPLAVAAAIYTGYFMGAAQRRKVKPGIELLEALPTVVIGFVAGLWLAPRLETHLAALIVFLLLLAPAIAGIAVLHGRRLPGMANPLRSDPLWTSAFVAAALFLTCLWLSDPLRQLLFDGDVSGWLQGRFDLSYEQRNSIVVGLAMGLAVMPTVFSLAEDAIFSVPRPLAHGSLALGATEWQTLRNVVLPSASPGIFSALMVGIGRAIGETMIVLMATGNTPIMDWGPLSGMRALSATIAMEMPEAEVGGTHFRVLFLAALLLFLFTFAMNTVAELIRQRLRRRFVADL